MSSGVCLGQFGAGNLQVLWGAWSQFGAVCWQPRQPTCLMGCVAGQFGAVCWQPTSLMGASLRLCVGNLQVLPVPWSQFWGAGRQPTCLMGCVGGSLGLYVGNLHVLWGVLEPVCGCMLATYRSYGVCLSQFVAGNLQVLWGVWQFGAVCWQPRQPTCLMGCVGASLGLYVGNLGNLHVLWGVLEPVCGCMLATYRSYEYVWASLGLYAGNLQVLWGVWSQFGAVCWRWQPTLEPVWGCMLATCRSFGVCGASLGLYVGNLGNLHV